jgi:uracil-DNA glycosylase family 4
MKCTKCKLALGRTNQVTAYGTPNSEIWFIKFAPSSGEDKLGTIMGSDKSYKFLSLMIEYGYDFNNTYYTSLTKCKGSSRVTGIETDLCIKNQLKGEIPEPAPKILVILGINTFNFLTHTHTIKKNRDLYGEWFKVGRFDNCTLAPDFTISTKDSDMESFRWHINSILTKLSLINIVGI